MNIMNYLVSFLVGGGICFLGQILVIRTKMTTARILVLFLVFGILLEAFGLYTPFEEFAKFGAIIPISGFGSTLASGAIEGAKTGTLLGIIKGGLTSSAAGIASSVLFSYIIAMVFKSRIKKIGKY